VAALLRLRVLTAFTELFETDGGGESGRYDESEAFDEVEDVARLALPFAMAAGGREKAASICALEKEERLPRSSVEGAGVGRIGGDMAEEAVLGDILETRVSFQPQVGQGMIALWLLRHLDSVARDGCRWHMAGRAMRGRSSGRMVGLSHGKCLFGRWHVAHWGRCSRALRGRADWLRRRWQAIGRPESVNVPGSGAALRWSSAERVGGRRRIGGPQVQSRSESKQSSTWGRRYSFIGECAPKLPAKSNSASDPVSTCCGANESACPADVKTQCALHPT
jgi:hypothetical protein